MATGINEYKIQVDKLEGPEDWAKWKWHVSMLLRSYTLENIIDGTRECPKLEEQATVAEVAAHQLWLKDDAKAASLLAGSLGKNVAELVLTCNHASEIWDKLHARFERSSTQRLNMLIEAFFRVQRDEKEDISTHVAKLQKLFVDLNDELHKHKENVLSERILNGRILSTLGKEYDNFKDLWDTIPSDNQSVNLLIEKLCTIELRDQSTMKSAAFVSSGVASSGAKKKTQKNKGKQTKENIERAKQKFPCHKCKQLGHWAVECPTKKTDGRNERTVALLPHALGASKNNYVEADKWYCDSGATNHVTANKQYFVSYTKFTVPEQISLGNRGVNMLAYGQGTVKIPIHWNNTWENVELTNDLYVPEANAHLFSVRPAARRGFRTKLDDRGVTLEDQITEKLYF